MQLGRRHRGGSHVLDSAPARARKGAGRRRGRRADRMRSPNRPRGPLLRIRALAPGTACAAPGGSRSAGGAHGFCKRGPARIGPTADLPPAPAGAPALLALVYKAFSKSPVPANETAPALERHGPCRGCGPRHRPSAGIHLGLPRPRRLWRPRLLARWSRRGHHLAGSLGLRAVAAPRRRPRTPAHCRSRRRWPHRLPAVCAIRRRTAGPGSPRLCRLRHRRHLHHGGAPLPAERDAAPGPRTGPVGDSLWVFGRHRLQPGLLEPGGWRGPGSVGGRRRCRARPVRPEPAGFPNP